MAVRLDPGLSGVDGLVEGVGTLQKRYDLHGKTDRSLLPSPELKPGDPKGARDQLGAMGAFDTGKTRSLLAWDTRAFSSLDDARAELIEGLKKDWEWEDKLSDADVQQVLKAQFGLDLENPTDLKTAITLVKLGFGFKRESDTNISPYLFMPLIEQPIFTAQKDKDTLTPTPTFKKISYAHVEGSQVYTVGLETSQGEVATLELDLHARTGTYSNNVEGREQEHKTNLTYVSYWNMNNQHRFATVTGHAGSYKMSLYPSGKNPGETISVRITHLGKVEELHATIPRAEAGRAITQAPRVIGNGMILEIAYRRLDKETGFSQPMVLWLYPVFSESDGSVEWADTVIMNRGYKSSMSSMGEENTRGENTLQREIDSILTSLKSQ